MDNSLKSKNDFEAYKKTRTSHSTALIKSRATELRQAGNLAEVLLWNELKNSKLNNIKFIRQKAIGHYIADFYSAKTKIIIEIDGDSHGEKVEYDKIREQYLISKGYKIIHLFDRDVKTKLSETIDYLLNHEYLK